MHITYSVHANDQIIARKLSKIWVEEAIQLPDVLVKEKPNKYYAKKKLNGLTIEVVYLKERYLKVVTVYLV